MIEDGQPPKREDCISINIKEYVDEKDRARGAVADARFRAIEDKIKFQSESSQQALDKAFISAQLAITEVKTSTAHSFENHNEWRAAMKDRETTYATRDDIKNINNRLAAFESRNMGLLVGVIIALFVALLAAYRTLSGL